jgi:hypothetical protein
MPRQFKVTVNGREYDVSVLELTAGQAAAQPSLAVDRPGNAGLATAGSASSAAPVGGRRGLKRMEAFIFSICSRASPPWWPPSRRS